jgi:hypothetical protein
MSTLKEPKPVKLIFSVIYNQSANLEAVKYKLTAKFGEIDYESSHLTFDHSDYYRNEMGDNLNRKFFSVKNLIKREEIVSIKQSTTELEKQYLINDKRTINVDPGYIAHEHFILATGKGFAHRPYLGNGVYADVTLIYSHNDYQSLDWTYPDYSETTVKNILKHLRKIYISDLCEVNKDD